MFFQKRMAGGIDKLVEFEKEKAGKEQIEFKPLGLR